MKNNMKDTTEVLIANGGVIAFTVYKFIKLKTK